MRVALGSIWQNGVRHIDRYVAQYYSLRAYCPEHTFEPLIVEGDSDDNGATWERLNRAFPGRVTKREHGGPTFGSVDDPQRWRGVSYACDGVLERVTAEHDALLWVEADLIWEPATMERLLGHLSRVDMVCAMNLMRGTFYDTWAFASAGVYFQAAPPYHTMLTKTSSNGLYPLDSGGSCWAVRGEVARTCRFRPPERAMRGFCEEVRAHGWHIWLDAQAKVEHPRVGGVPASVAAAVAAAMPQATGHLSALMKTRVR